ncbi:MAG: cupin domain-containing protein [Verrucomicrobiota bacterium]
MKSIQTLLCIIGIFLSAEFLKAHPPEKSNVEESSQDSTSGGVEVISIDEQSWYEAADKAVAREFASPRNSRAQHISVADIIIPGGVKVVPHKHAWEEVYIITAGRGQMMVEDKYKEVKAGDSVVILPNEWHTIENLDPKADLRLTVVCAPFWRPEGLIFDRDAPES